GSSARRGGRQLPQQQNAKTRVERSADPSEPLPLESFSTRLIPNCVQFARGIARQIDETEGSAGAGVAELRAYGGRNQQALPQRLPRLLDAAGDVYGFPHRRELHPSGGFDIADQRGTCVQPDSMPQRRQAD